MINITIRTTATQIATPEPIQTSLVILSERQGTDRFCGQFLQLSYVIYTHLS
uniref:Uncharacterized protein n=1 Tax=Anguilla anguilla TaxID=7936 RepID=A0A0E9XWA1_ANGAN